MHDAHRGSMAAKPLRIALVVVGALACGGPFAISANATEPPIYTCVPLGPDTPTPPPEPPATPETAAQPNQPPREPVCPDGSVPINTGPARIGPFVPPGVASIATDVTPPNVVGLRGPAKVKRGRPARFMFGSSEAGSQLLCSVDNRPRRACTAPRKVSSKMLKLGTHRFSVTAADAAGNVDATPSHLVFKIVH